MPLLGSGFDGFSAHGFRVRASGSDDAPRSSLKLRPGEQFYVQDLSLILVPEGKNDQYTQLTSSGFVPSYEQYNQHMSQVDLQSQPPLLTPSPAKLKRPYAAILETPSKKSPSRSQLIQGIAANAIAGRDDSQNWPATSAKRAVLYTVRDAKHNNRGDFQAFSNTAEPKCNSLQEANILKTEVADPDIPGKIRAHAPNSTPNPGPEAGDESQGDLAGKTVETENCTRTPATASDPPTLSGKQASFLSSCGTKSDPRTPSTNSSEPSSSLRSTRAVIREGSHRLSVQDNGLRIIFSSASTVGDSRVFKKFLTEQGVKIVQELKDATLLCVGNAGLKKTTKLILAVLMGIVIVRDSWVTESARLKQLQDLGAYTAKDPQREQEWGITIGEAIERGRRGITVFEEWTIVITPSAKKDLGKDNFTDFKTIATCAGAKSITTKIPKQSDNPIAYTLIIATLADLTLPTLANQRCYSKDILSLSILRGKLDAESDEFLLRNGPGEHRVSKKRKH